MNYKVPLALVLISVSLYYFLSPASPLSDTQLTEHLNDKVVLICGASSGIGEELAYQLAAHGAKLVLVAQGQDKLDKVRVELLDRGTIAGNVMTISFDFSDVSGSKKVVDQTLEKFGALDYLVSNHATMAAGPILALPDLHTTDYIENIFRVNLFSHIELAIHALPHLEKRKGHMFFTSSILGEVPWYMASIYTSTKHAMNGFFYSLQQELLARDSPASLTVGIFGLIRTKEVDSQFPDKTPFYDWTIGSLEGCARVMMEAFVTRSQTVTFHKLAGVTYRALWYFVPHFYHNDMIEMTKPFLYSPEE